MKLIGNVLGWALIIIALMAFGWVGAIIIGALIVCGLLILLAKTVNDVDVVVKPKKTSAQLLAEAAEAEAEARYYEALASKLITPEYLERMVFGNDE